MQIVIDIPEEDYKNVSRIVDMGLGTNVDEAIKNGTPLPKGHGRLGDLSKIYVELNEAQVEGTEEYKGLGEAKQIICNAPTIIEAESEDKE